MLSIGIDGFRGGWVAAVIDNTDRCEFYLVSRMIHMITLLVGTPFILGDIPIGLPDTPEDRECDRIARRLLGRPRASSVFPVPCREAIYSESYHEACEANLRVLGKSISLQSWLICGKIREVDELLASHPTLRGRIRESHPELCFRAFAGGKSMERPKRTPVGFLERLRTLSGVYPHAEDALRNTTLRGAGLDDLLDALALAAAAGQRLVSVPDLPRTDGRRLPMEIMVPETISSSGG
jgi:predicted RNase H-like nuclease